MNFQRRTLLFFILIIITLTSCKDKNKGVEILANDIVFQKVLDSIYTENPDSVGLMVHVESPDIGISWSGASGLSNKQTKTILANNQPVLIASNTKTYVAVTILRLVEKGKIELDSKIDKYITLDSNLLLEQNGYRPNDITIKHLLTHTSGLFDYAGSEAFFKFILEKPNYRWTRDAQIQLAMTAGKPLGKAGELFSYSDTNYLLLTEIIETLTEKDFYTAIRELLNFEELNLDATWFSTLEDYPKSVKPLAYQYSTKEGVNSYSLDHSFDLYGGGGLAATTKDLALFLHNVFSNKVFESPKTLELLYTEVNPIKPREWDYYLGVAPVDYDGIKGIGHNGYWGTVVNHFPEINTTISVFVLERDKRYLRKDLSKAYLKALKDLN